MKKVKGIEFVGVCTASGVSAQHVSRKFGFEFATTDEGTIINNPDINTVVIATRHHLHARQVIAALKAGKHVFVEKPLCINEAELAEIAKTYYEVNGWKGEPLNGEFSSISSQPLTSNLQPPSQILMVGYNRRFSPMGLRLKEFLSKVDEPLIMHYRINAGYIPPEHWVHDPEQGGGRIIGEVCHFVDFMTFVAGALPKQVYARALANNNRYKNDNLVVDIEFANGSIGTITYVANGDVAFSKERIEVFGGGAVAVIDNFRTLDMIGNGRKESTRTWFRQDKGHQEEWEELSAHVSRGGGSAASIDEMSCVAACTFAIKKSLEARQLIVIASDQEVSK
jgi:predicted dehydrogenase